MAMPLFAADDPAKLLAALRTTKDAEELERVVDKIADLGDAGGSSTAAVKKQLLEGATPKLIEIAENKSLEWSLRGSAIHALRDMGAPRDVLTRVAQMALKDSDEYVKSRGEILQNYIDSMPAENETAALRPKDPAKEREAIAFLEEHNLGVSLDQLRMSSLDAEPEQVQALIDAGVDVNGGSANDSPLVSALSACAHQGGENEQILKTIDVLLAAGSDLKRLDENKNTPLMTAAQYCSAGAVTKLLDAGAEPNVTNGSGVNPLAMALIMSRLDAAEVLAAKGARLSPDQVTMVSSIATDERAKAIVTKASAKK
jgi:Ankyrin repeats (3 copies)